MGQAILQYLLRRLQEASTWRGIILVLTALGMHIKPELAEAIVILGIALAGGVGIVAPDRMQPMSVGGDADSGGRGSEARVETGSILDESH